jgi:hypothetical protein
VDETVVSELEAAIADTGALLVRAQKYRRGAGAEGAALAREALALGDRARRLHRHGTLERQSATLLLGEAGALLERARTFLRSIQASPEYREAVRAHGHSDQPTLARLVPDLFAGLEAASPPPALFHAVPWLHRGRLRPVPEVTAEVLRVASEGLEAEGDDLSPGADTLLPAVVLLADPPAEEPVVVRVDPPPALPLYRLVESNEYLIYTPLLRVTPVVLLAPSLPTDEQLRVDLTPEDYERHRRALTAALAAAGVPVSLLARRPGGLDP